MLYDRLWIIGDTCSDNNMSAGQYYIYKYNNVRWHTSSAAYIYILILLYLKWISLNYLALIEKASYMIVCLNHYNANHSKQYRALLGLHGNSTEGFLLKNLYCLECIVYTTHRDYSRPYIFFNSFSAGMYFRRQKWNEMNRVLGHLCSHISRPGQENLLRVVRWMRWHCPPDTGFEIWKAKHATCRSRRLPTILNLHEWAERTHFVSLKLGGQSGVRARDLRLSRQVVLTTAPWSPPHFRRQNLRSPTLKQHWVNVVSFLRHWVLQIITIIAVLW